jgi:hypothetical protein
MTKKEAEHLTKIADYDDIEPTTRLVLIKIRLAELSGRELTSHQGSVWMVRENIRRLKKRNLLDKDGRTCWYYQHEKALVIPTNDVGITNVGNTNARVRTQDPIISQENPKNCVGITNTEPPEMGSPLYTVSISTITEKQNHISSVCENHVLVKPTQPSSRLILKWMTMAELFCRTIQKVDGFRYQKHLKKWADQFRLLHEEDGVATQVIWKVLKWYCHMREQKVDSNLPRCVTANMFRGAFGWILEKWEAQGEGIATIEQRWIDAAAAIFERTDISRTSVTQKSLASLYQQIADWRTSILLKLKKDDRIDQTRRRLLSGLLNHSSDGAHLAEQVVSYLCDRVGEWEGWNGGVSAFKPGGHEFIKFIRMRARQFWEMNLGDRDIEILFGGADAQTED